MVEAVSVSDATIREEAVSEADGMFRIRGLAPGKYKVGLKTDAPKHEHSVPREVNPHPLVDVTHETAPFCGRDIRNCACWRARVHWRGWGAHMKPRCLVDATLESSKSGIHAAPKGIPRLLGTGVGPYEGACPD